MSDLPLWRRLLWPVRGVPPPPPVAPGVYPYQRLEGEWPTRFHLRVDPEGSGLLLANAAEAAYLSPTGVLMAQGLLEGQDDTAVTAQVRSAFGGAAPGQVAQDLDRLHQLLDDLAQPGDNYPITDLSDPRAGETGRALLAPLRADLTQPPLEMGRELLRRLWEAGIPHVTIFTDPQAPAEELPLLVEAAEDLGMLAGLRAPASWLSPQILREAALAGLDHLDLPCVSALGASHDRWAGLADYSALVGAFAQCRELELCPVAEIPLFAGNLAEVPYTVGELRAEGVTNLVFWALACPDGDEPAERAGALAARRLPQVAEEITEASEDTQARFLWAPPVRYDARRSLEEHLRRGPRTAGDVAIRVEADGRVLPPRGPAQTAGNLLSDTWESIWAQEAFRRWRERLAATTRCATCPDLALCAADCPKDPRGWSDDTSGGEQL